MRRDNNIFYLGEEAKKIKLRNYRRNMNNRLKAEIQEIETKFMLCSRSYSDLN